MKPGDLVKMKRGYSPAGIVLQRSDRAPDAFSNRYVLVLWPDDGKSMEKVRDLEVIQNAEG